MEFFEPVHHFVQREHVLDGRLDESMSRIGAVRIDVSALVRAVRDRVQDRVRDQGLGPERRTKAFDFSEFDRACGDRISSFQ